MSCGTQQRVATAAELQQLGTKTYPGRSRADVRTAVLTALKVQGYEVITTDPMIRTSPKLVAVTTAVSGDQYTAQAQSFGESVAWDVDVQGDEQSATLHATPRASVNGQAMDQVFYDWAQRTFTQLMAEIDRSLPTQH